MTEGSPKVTVLLPVYNNGQFLYAAMDSILVQTWADMEVLAIDDGSTDDSLQILRSYSDLRICIVEHPKNKGLIATLNEGIAMAKGQYIARMDGDDVMAPERIAEQVAYLDSHPEVAVLGSFVAFMNTDGEVTGTWGTDRATPDEAPIHAMLPRTNCIAHPSVMIRRAALGELRYDPRQVGAEDWDLWLRMRSRGLCFAKLPKVLLNYRVHSTSMMAVAKRTVPYELRLLLGRRRFLTGEWSRGRFTTMHLAVLKAQARTGARHLRNNVLFPFLRDTYRLLTYSPFKLLRERLQLRKALSTWKGRHVFAFSYFGTGGAEQVHADIMATVADQHPLIVITGFSRDAAFAKRYATIGTLLEVPRLVHHPFTAKRARQQITAAMNAREDAVLFGSNTDHFFNWLPLLKNGTKAIQLIHAFLHQPERNVKHKAWLTLFGRIDRYVFVSRQAMDDFEAFLFANNVPRSVQDKLEFIPNAVERFGSVRDHERTGLLFVGRDSPEKRLRVFLALTDRLVSAYPGRFRFTVVGSDAVSGHSHVAFAGTVNDPSAMAAIYAEHDLLALTSSREGFPMVVMEAMANGLVVMATPVGDVPNRLDPSFAVITTSVEEEVVVHEMFSAAVELDGDRERMDRMKMIALAKAQQEFDLARFRERYRALLMSPAS